MNTKKHFTLKKGVTKIVILLLACFITMPTLNAVNVLPNVKVNKNSYHKVAFDTKSKAIAVLNNNLYAVWQGEPTNTTSNIYFSKSIDGGLSFSTELNIYQGASSLSHLWASLYVTPDAKIHIAWAVSAVKDEYNIWYTNSEDGGQSFKTPIIITTNNASIFPCIGGYGNNVYIFYGSMENYPIADYYFTRSTNNGTSFETPIQINDAPCQGNVDFDGLNTMTIGADGTIYLAWADGRRAEGEGDIFFAKSVNQGLSFSANVMVNDINGIGANAIQNMPSIAVEGDNVYVAFSDKRLGDGWLNKRAYLSVSTNGGSSFYSENLLAGYTGAFTSFDIAVSASGKLSVALSGFIMPNWSVWLYESLNKGMSFSTPIALNDVNTTDRSDVQLMAMPGDYVGAFWKDNRATSYDLYFTKTSAQTTYIPDDNFLQALIDLGYGTGVVDKCIPTSNLSGITNLDVSSKNISDLTGIEDFDALVSLNCSNNKLINFDISEKTALKELYCQNNQLSDIHLYNNTNLEVLNCSNNKLMGLNVFNNTALTFLHCNSNQFTSLDIRNGNNANMTDFDASDNLNLSCIIVNDKTAGYLSDWTKDVICSFVNNESECSFPIAYTKIPDNNFLQALISLGYDDGVLGNFVPTSNIDTIINLDLSEKNISNLTGIEDFAALKELNCSNNNLSSLNVQSNSALEILNFDSNGLLNIDVSNNTLLSGLSCMSNKLKSLDLSKNTVLEILYCSFNDLKSLDIRNGNNANITAFEATENPNLTCIYVNDKTAGYLSGWLKDATAKWANNELECGPPIAYTHLPDNNFLQVLKDLGYGAG
ncbi:MAG TPA: hypothetical protein VJY41_12185, partial [Prolixibacteraceae bacterium]|nr:hypothetical protein [Prolixibacteraceae bacterium]